MPVYYASPSQINAQVPYAVAPGPAVVQLGSSTVSVPVASAAPGIFKLAGDLAVLETAMPGSFVSVYLTGQGAVSPPVPTGAAAPDLPTVLRVAESGGNHWRQERGGLFRRPGTPLRRIDAGESPRSRPAARRSYRDRHRRDGGQQSGRNSHRCGGAGAASPSVTSPVPPQPRRPLLDMKAEPYDQHIGSGLQAGRVRHHVESPVGGIARDDPIDKVAFHL